MITVARMNSGVGDGGGVYQIGWGTYKGAFTHSKATVLFLDCQCTVEKPIIVSEQFLPPCHSISGNFLARKQMPHFERSPPFVLRGFNEHTCLVDTCGNLDFDLDC